MRPFAVQRRAQLLLLLLVCALVTGACDGGTRRSDGDPRSVRPPRSLHLAGDVTVDAYDTGATGRVDAMVVDGRHTALLLSRREYGAGDTVVRSGDAGRTWHTSTTGLGSLRGDGIGAGASLAGTGSTLVATRTVYDPAPPGGTCCGTLQRQEAVLSTDGGRRWSPLALPVPDGSTALVADLVDHEGTIVVVGALQAAPPPGVAVPQSHDALDDLYDAAVWRRGRGGTTFERVPVPPLDGAPGRQGFGHVVWQRDRFVAVGGDTRSGPRRDDISLSEAGVMSYAATDGTAWTELPGIPPGAPLVRGGDALLPGSDALSVVTRTGGARLDVGAPRWAPEPELRQILPAAGGQPAREAELDSSPDRLDVGGGQIVTWVLDSACDCNVAMVGRAVDGVVTATGLTFERCEDPDSRENTMVGAPVTIGGAVVAPAGCSDHGRRSARLAVTTDGGTSWRTERLARLAPRGRDLSVTSAGEGWRAAAVDHRRLVLAAVDATPGADALEHGSGAVVGRVVVLVVHAA